MNNPNLFEYYVDLLDEYYNIKVQLEKFKKSIEQCDDDESFIEYKRQVREKNDEIIAMFKDSGLKHEEISKFKDYDYEKDMTIKNKILITKSNNIKKDIYNEDSVGEDKIFISIDLKSANFSMIKNFDSKIFNEKDSWRDFMLEYGVNDFIASSKQFREVFFGEINMCKKTSKIYKYSLDKALTLIKEKYGYKDEDIVCISGDEIVLKYNKNYPEDLQKTYPE